MLLFADDLVLLGTALGVVQQQLAALASFCAGNGLTVSIKKTKWMLGGRVPRALPVA